MLHLVLYVLLAIVVAVGLFLAATRFLPAGEQIAPAIRDEPVWELPAERSLRPEDVDTVRLPVALRGYRFAETDVLLDRLAGELRARDAEIARLRGDGTLPESSPHHEPVQHEPAELGDAAAPGDAAATRDDVAPDQAAAPDDAAAHDEPEPAETAAARTADVDDDRRFAPPPAE